MGRGPQRDASDPQPRVVIVVDTSAWIEYLRGSGHPVHLRLRALRERKAELAVTEIVLMEVLAGARSGAPLERIRSLLVGMPVLRLEGIVDFEEAASIYRACREAGHTLRSQIDLLVAVPTMRHEASLLHNDRDFDLIARHSPLRIEPVGSPEQEQRLQERAGPYRKQARTPPPRRRSTRARERILA